MADLALRPVEPVGTRRGMVHRNYGYREDRGRHFLDPRTGWYEEDLPVYPDTHVAAGRALREERIQRVLTLGEAARRADIQVSDVSGLERGRMTCDREELLRRWDAHG
jgi:hypothetical protein